MSLGLGKHQQIVNICIMFTLSTFNYLCNQNITTIFEKITHKQHIESESAKAML